MFYSDSKRTDLCVSPPFCNHCVHLVESACIVITPAPWSSRACKPLFLQKLSHESLECLETQHSPTQGGFTVLCSMSLLSFAPWPSCQQQSPPSCSSRQWQFSSCSRSTLEAADRCHGDMPMASTACCLFRCAPAGKNVRSCLLSLTPVAPLRLLSTTACADHAI